MKEKDKKVDIKKIIEQIKNKNNDDKETKEPEDDRPMYEGDVPMFG